MLGIGGHQVINGEMTYGQMVEFLQYIALLIVPLRSIGMTVAFGQRAAAALMRVDEVLRTEPAVADPAQPHELPDAAAGRCGSLPRRPLRLPPGLTGPRRLRSRHRRR